MNTLKSINLKKELPNLGVYAFALGSTWALFNLFQMSAIHQSPIYWIPAAIVEIVNAWTCRKALAALRHVTYSVGKNITKQDKKFYSFILVFYIVLLLPTVIVSVVANTIEFDGNVLLGMLFPFSSIVCAIGSELYEITDEHVKRESRTASSEHAEEVARLRSDIKRLQAELNKHHAMEEPTSSDFERVFHDLRVKRNGSGANITPYELNIALNRAGFHAIPEGTARSRMQKMGG